MRHVANAPAWVRVAARLVRHLPAGRYRAMNRICRRPAREFLRALPEDSGGYTYVCDLRDFIAREVCFTGQYEPQQTAIMRGLLKRGMTFLDAGANWGYFTLLAAHLVGRRGRVVSLEPDPRLFATLEENINRNKLEQVTLLPIAAASEKGMLVLAGFDEREGNWGLSKIVKDAESASHAFSVRADSIDTLLDELEIDSVDVLKMDIEGAEDLALAGMRRGLERGRYKCILLEVHPALLRERGRSVQDALQILAGCGYSGWLIDHSPEATRRAAYARRLRPVEYLRKIEGEVEKEIWPHLLWTSPSVKELRW